MAEDNGYPVKLYVYDISKGMAGSLSQAFLGKQIDGIWHTGIVVYGQEFYFGGLGGIESCKPGGTILGQPDTIEDLGMTQVPFEMFHSYLSQLSQSSFNSTGQDQKSLCRPLSACKQFLIIATPPEQPSSYHLLENNCNSFSSEVAQFLTGKDIPAKITGLPAEVLSTPFGQMIKPWVDAMSVQPSGGHAVFPGDNSSFGSQDTDPTVYEAEASKDAEDDKADTATAKSGPSTDWDKAVADTWQEPEEEPAGEVEDPVVFMDKPPDRKELKDQIFDKIPMKDLGLVSDIFDYLSEGDSPSWSLGKEHIQTIHTIIGNGKMGDAPRAGVCTIIQNLILREDFLVLLQHEPTQLIQKVMEHFEQLSEAIQEAILKLLTNCCSYQMGHKFLTTSSDTEEENMLKFTTQVCVSCLLKDKGSLYVSGSALAFNLSRYQLTEDTQVEIGSAVLECLQKECNEETVYNLMQSLLQMMETNTELCDLASVVGLNCSQHQKLSPRVRRLCDKAQELSAL